jgi:hypothetical protein
MPKPAGVLAEIDELVGVGHVERHRGGEELDRIMRLEIGGLVGDDAVGGGVRLVEAVICELGEQVEDHVGLRLGDIALDRAFDETDALLVHLFLDLLAHGAAQQVGFAERVAGQHLGDLHHLLLVDDHALGFGQSPSILGWIEASSSSPCLRAL